MCQQKTFLAETHVVPESLTVGCNGIVQKNAFCLLRGTLGPIDDTAALQQQATFVIEILFM